MGRPYNNDDIFIVKDAVLFPHILNALEFDISNITDSNMKMKEVYIRLLKKAQDDATLSFYEVKKRMRHSGIKFIDEINTDDKTTTKFIVRGYQHEFSMSQQQINIAIQIRLAKYLKVDLTDKKTDP